MINTITFEGHLAEDPQLHITPSGKQIAELTVLVNERRRNADGEWEDRPPTRHVVKAFKQLGQNVAESLNRGNHIIVHGTITTETWTDKESGAKRSAQRILADSIGPSLQFATITTIVKNPRATASHEHDAA